MEYVFLAMVVLAVLHFVYEGIIAPSLRMQCRNELFKQRDALRRIKIQRHADSRDPAFDIIHSTINGYLTCLSGVTLHFMWRLRSGVRSGKLREETQARLKALEDCKSEQLIGVGQAMGNAIERAFLINSLAWAFYVVPVLLLILGMHLISKVTMKLVALPVEWSVKLLQREAGMTNGHRTELSC